MHKIFHKKNQQILVVLVAAIVLLSWENKSKLFSKCDKNEIYRIKQQQKDKKIKYSFITSEFCFHL